MGGIFNVGIIFWKMLQTQTERSTSFMFYVLLHGMYVLNVHCMYLHVFLVFNYFM